MNYLIDTNVFLWSCCDETKISKKALAVMKNINNDLFLSSVIIWEIMIKIQHKRLKLPVKTDRFFTEQISALKLTPIPIQISHAENLYNLPNHHKDPFDRMLISQAQVENMPIISSDRLLSQYNVKIIW